MDLAFQRRVDAFGSGNSANTCNVGPTETTWHFDDGTPDVGRLLCIDQFAGIRFDWTDDRVNILSSMVDFDGNYARTYDDWQVAGPNELPALTSGKGSSAIFPHCRPTVRRFRSCTGSSLLRNRE